MPDEARKVIGNSFTPKDHEQHDDARRTTRKQFDKLQIPAHRKVDMTLVRSGTKFGIIGSPFKPKR